MLVETEVAVVGGGPAGLATAMELRRCGLEVTVIDRALPPIDKACGEGLMPDGVRCLSRLGVRIPVDRRVELGGIRYLEGDIHAPVRFRRGHGMGVRRTVLHQAMIERAGEVGVRLVWGVSVRGLEQGRLLTDEGPMRAKWIVGADGLHSRVRRWAGLDSPRARFSRYGVRRHFARAPWTDLVEVYWRDDCEAYVTPVSPGEVGVAMLWSGDKANFNRLLRRFPKLQEHLADVPQTSRDRGAGRLEQRSRGVYRERVALVGDAAGYRDAITGEGLSLAFHQARALAEAISTGRLHPYARAVRRLTTLPFALIRFLLEVERRPRLRHRLIHTLARNPEVFGRFLAVHTRELPARSLLPGVLLQLLWGLLAPERVIHSEQS